MRRAVGACVDARLVSKREVHAFDIVSGRQLWMSRAGRGVVGAITSAEDRAVVYTASGDLVALNLDAGAVQWSHSIKAPPWESPGAFGSRVFAGSTDGSVYGVDARSGRVVWDQSIGSPIATSVRATASGVFVGTADGFMHRLSAATGERLSSLKLDPALVPVSAPLVTSEAVFVLLADSGADHRALVSLDPTLKAVKWRLARQTGGALRGSLPSDRRYSLVLRLAR